MSLAPTIVGLILIVFAVVSLIKLMRDVFIAFLMVGVLLLGVFMFVNSIPELSDRFKFDKMGGGIGVNKTTGDKIQLPEGVERIVLAVKGKGESLDVVATGTDETGNLLVVVANTGKDDLKDFAISVEGKPVTWKNNPLVPLGSGKSTVFQTNYRPVGEVNVEVKAGNATAIYP